jgi:hypothetical protein
MANRPTYKTDEWMQLETQFRDLDNGGKIDSGILDLVVVLNLIGIHTAGSCMGHFKTEIEPNILKYMEKTGRPLPEEKNQEFTHYPYIDIYIEDVWKLQALLEAFYAGDFLHNDYELGIVITPRGGMALLKNIYTLNPYSIPVEDSELASYQQEFRAFTSWLKRRWQQLRKELQVEPPRNTPGYKNEMYLQEMSGWAKSTKPASKRSNPQ